MPTLFVFTITIKNNLNKNFLIQFNTIIVSSLSIPTFRIIVIWFLYPPKIILSYHYILNLLCPAICIILNESENIYLQIVETNNYTNLFVLILRPCYYAANNTILLEVAYYVIL